MSIRDHKRQIYSELESRYQSRGAGVTIADSILVWQEGRVTKIPMRKCAEEVFIINTFQRLNIPTVDIMEMGSIETQIGKVDSYTMKTIDGAQDISKHGNRYMSPNYYDFLRHVFDQLQTVPMQGAGAIEQTASSIRTQFSTDKELLQDVFQRTRARGYWHEGEMDALETELSQYQKPSDTVLAHTDILNNIVADGDNNFYLIDPQTIVSAANKYWDLSYYLIYANGFGCTKGLAEFVKTRNIKDDWGLFMLTAKINAYERTSFYTQYDLQRVPGMLAFLESLKEGNIRIGDVVLTKEDL